MSSVEKPRFSATPETVERAVQFLAPPGSSPDRVAAAMRVAAELEAARNSFRFSFHPEMSGSANSEVLGNKAACLVEMTRMGVPVPPFFTLTTDAWRAFSKEDSLPDIVWQETQRQLALLEKKTNLKFGDPTVPLVVSVRSGAPYSMPGLLETVLNVGLNDQTVAGLAKRTDEWCAWDSYRRGIESLGKSACGVEMEVFTSILALFRGRYHVSQNQDLKPPVLKELVEKYKETIKDGCDRDFPQSPDLQLKLAIEAVMKSWNSKVATLYREGKGIPFERGTAVTIQTMVFGNQHRENSGAGVYFTRDPNSIIPAPKIAYESGVSGSDIVGATASHRLADPSALSESFREELRQVGQQLEERYLWPQEVELTVERGRLWVLQTRDARLQPLTALSTLKEFVDEGKLDTEEAVRHLGAHRLRISLAPGLSRRVIEKAQKEGQVLGESGGILSAGIAQGKVARSLKEAQELTNLGQSPVLVLEKLTNEELAALPKNVGGVILQRGGLGSHIAQLLRNAKDGQGIPALSGLDIDLFNPQEEITLDANHGLVLKGKLPLARRAELSPKLSEFLKECTSLLRENPWLTACYPVEKNLHYATLERKARDAWQKSKEKWHSPKAWSIELMQAIIPPEMKMGFSVLSVQDLSGLPWSLRRILEEGNEASVRTCHNPPQLTQAPWKRIASSDDIERFLVEDYPRWREDPALAEIVVGRIPQGVLDPKLAQDHCAFTVSCDGDRVFIQIQPHTVQLRDLETADLQNLITIEATLDPERRMGLGQLTTRFGQNLENDPQTRQFADLVTQAVFQKWWRPPYALPHYLAALTKVAQITSVDGQARLDPNGGSWCLIYDIKGKES